MTLSLTTFTQPCSITAWIAAPKSIIEVGHGFIEFDCKNMQRVVGFNPRTDSIQNVLTNSPFHGLLTSLPEHDLLESCMSKKISCSYARLETTPEIVEKAWLEQEAIREAIRKDIQDLSYPNAPIKRTYYRLWSNNCLHFMSHIMDSTGIANWRQMMVEYSPPSLKEKVFNFASHYFRAMQIFGDGGDF